MIQIFTDGSCLGNPGPGGWGVILKVSPTEVIELTGSSPMTTNNKMELKAAIEALKWLDKQQISDCVEIWTDSNYVKDGITKWIFSWKKNGWKNSKKEPVKNKELWQALDLLNNQLNLSWNWVKAHNGHSENEAVDKLAYQSAMNAHKESNSR